MSFSALDEPRQAADARSTLRLGFWSASATSVLTAAALALGILTPARSGPFCLSDCVEYPYTDIAAFVPGDYYWMYPISLAALAYVVVAACIHGSAHVERRIYGSVGLAFASIAATVLGIAYFAQLAVVQPSLLKGEAEGLTLLSMYNPHGLFIALEDLGLLMLSVSFLFCAAALKGRTGLERRLRRLLAVCGAAVFVALPILALAYGQDLGYRFEVTAILINWPVLIIAGSMLAVHFRRRQRDLAAS